MPINAMTQYFRMSVLSSLVLITGLYQPKTSLAFNPPKTGSRILISAKDLKKEISSHQFQIIDARSSAEYHKEHLPLAVHVDIRKWKKKSLEPNGLADTSFWASAIGSLGIGPETEVIVYSAVAPNAARASWLLGYQGVKNVTILDGGWRQWKEVSGETTDQIPTVKQQDFKPSPQTDWLISTKEVQQNFKTLQIADARSVVEYVGKGRHKGHIPGAIRLEWSDLLNENGTYKSKKDLQALIKSKGFKPDQQVITHCQTGGRSSVNIIAFKLAGYPTIKNYYCGWSEWSADDSLPIEKPEAN